MFGILVEGLCPDRVAELSFSTGERQIPFIVSLLGSSSACGERHSMSTASSVQQMTLPVWAGARS